MSEQNTTAVATTDKTSTSVLARLAGRFGVDENKMMSCLKGTAFKGKCTNEQLMALCIVSDQYKLNPWTKEIYAFPDKQNGIVPVVGVDGWSRIINEHPQFDGMDFDQDEEKCTCRIYRKDRKHAISTTEYMSECKRNTGPWGSHPKRMLRHKALIQCARLAFGFAGIYDQDEAERIIDAKVSEPAYHRKEKESSPLSQAGTSTKPETVKQDTAEPDDISPEPEPELTDEQKAEQEAIDELPLD